MLLRCSANDFDMVPVAPLLLVKHQMELSSSPRKTLRSPINITLASPSSYFSPAICRCLLKSALKLTLIHVRTDSAKLRLLLAEN